MAQPGKDWKPTVKLNPSKMLVVDMAAVPKAWAYFMHHTLDTNRSGSDLIAKHALELYLLLTHHSVNIGQIIAEDIDEMAQSPKKSLGHATVIWLLCQKAGVPDFASVDMVKPARSLDTFWLRENSVAREAPYAGVRRNPRRQPEGGEPSDPLEMRHLK